MKKKCWKKTWPNTAPPQQLHWLRIILGILATIQYPHSNRGTTIWWFYFFSSTYFPYAPCMEYLPTFTYIYPKNHPNVGKYTSTMEHMGFWCVIWCSRWMPEGSFCIASSRERIAIMSGTQPFRGIHPDQWEISRIQLMEVRYYHIRPYELWGYSLKIRPKK